MAKTQEDLNTKILPVILSGGRGTRLWPLSRSSYPKQYLAIDRVNKYTFLQSTALRLSGIKNIQSPLIICNEEQRFVVAEQMRAINIVPESILLEPFGKNTAPAIAMSALLATKKNLDPILLILPSDHKIKDVEAFQNKISEGIKIAKEGNLITFGIVPKSPETQYGYIKSKDEICKTNKSSDIVTFIEKPNKEIAEKLFMNKKYTWNSGIFIFKASTILKELNKFVPEIVQICIKSLEGIEKDLNFQRINHTYFKTCPKIALDVAVMEKTKIGKVLPLDAGWNDLGSWKSVWEDSKKDIDENTFHGNVFAKDVKNSYLRSENRLLVGFGLKNLCVVETDDSVLIANKDSLNSMKELISELEDQNFEELSLNQKVHRPWGHYTSIMRGEKWLVKRLVINPMESLSLQMHKHRSENWVIVKGIAKVEIENEISFLNVNESTYVPIGAKHRLSNPNKEKLVLIEVQSGSYLGEDDIIRFEDKYRR